MSYNTSESTSIANSTSFVENVESKKINNNIIKTIIEKSNLVEMEKFLEFQKNYLSYMDAVKNFSMINKGKFYHLLSKKLKIPLYNYSDLESKSSLLERKLVSTQLLTNLNIIVFRDDKRTEWELVVDDPFNYEVIDYIKSKVTGNMKMAISESHNIKKVVKKLNKRYETSIALDSEYRFEKRDLMKYTSGSNKLPIIPFVYFVVLEAKRNGASDIHIEPTEEELIVRYRIDGVLQTEIALPLIVHKEVVSRIKIMSDMNVAEKRLPQDGRFDVTDLEGNKMDMRVSTFPTVYGEKVVMRLLEQDALKPSLEDLNLDDENLELFRNKINSPYGLILLTGPTGSGKTTTLYSALSTIDKNSKNVLTVEDPVEYRLEGVHQMQTNEKIGLTFASGLRTILRQDPDIVMVGEIRDLETANMAIRASLTGHIVFSTLHTNDSIGVIIRLINMGIEPFLVSSSVTLAVAQRLVRKICPDCVDYKSGEMLREELRENGITDSKLMTMNIELDNDLTFAYGNGCSNCRGTGYRGRQAVFEFFEPTTEINQEILKPDFDENRVREIAKKNGMKTLLDNGLELVDAGITTIDEVIRVIGE